MAQTHMMRYAAISASASGSKNFCAFYGVYNSLHPISTKKDVMKNITLLLILTLISCKSTLLAQSTGEISGVIYDSLSGEEIPGANVYVEVDGEKIGGTTDINGCFTIKSLKPGLYDVKVSFIGYVTQTVVDIKVFANQVTSLYDIKLIEDTLPKGCYGGPLFQNKNASKFETSGQEIHNLPYR